MFFLLQSRGSSEQFKIAQFAKTNFFLHFQDIFYTLNIGSGYWNTYVCQYSFIGIHMLPDDKKYRNLRRQEINMYAKKLYWNTYVFLLNVSI